MASVALRADSKIVGVGGTSVRRCNANGSLDTASNATLVNINASENGVIVQPDGKIVAFLKYICRMTKETIH